MSNPLDSLPLETRVARLEGKLGWRRTDFQLSQKISMISCGATAAALVLAFLGLGAPNHYYQVVLAVITVALAYHREWFVRPEKIYLAPLAILNSALLSILYKLMIGSGKRYPFFWALYPTVEKSPAPDGRWPKVVPDVAIAWQTSPLAEWSMDLTIVQTFLLLVTLLGALFDFQPFTSFTALLLIVVSIPALLAFNWTFVFPALIVAGIAFYLQSASYQEDV